MPEGKSNNDDSIVDIRQLIKIQNHNATGQIDDGSLTDILRMSYNNSSTPFQPLSGESDIEIETPRINPGSSG